MKKKIGLLTFGILFLMINMNTASAAIGAPEFYDKEAEITLKLNFDFQLLTENGNNVSIWMPLVNNWSSVQKSSMVTTEFNDITVSEHDPYDIHNNSYDFFNKEITTDLDFNMSYEYNVKLNSKKWIISEDLTLLNYNTSTELYKKYTRANENCESNDSSIISTADTITDGKNTLDGIITEIYDYVVENIEYKIDSENPEPKNLTQTLDDQFGDCSEYANLMVGFLRAKGIPARKVLGLVFVEDGGDTAGAPKFSLQPGDTFSYNSKTTTLPLHAWVQYYIPDLGWVSADPTWGNSLYESGGDSSEYLHGIDYIRLITTVGSWYEEGIDPSFIETVPPYTGGAEITYSVFSIEIYDLDYEIKYTITILDAQYSKYEMSMFEYILIASFIGIIALFAIAHKHKKKKRGMNVYRDRKGDDRGYRDKSGNNSYEFIR